jgi:lantibiotic biosynthesis protein
MRVLTDWSDGVEAPDCAPEELAEALERDRELLGERLSELAARPELQGALSVASPDLLDGLRERPGDPGVHAALVRYVARMAARPTPFGLFAGCGVGAIGEHTQIALADPKTWSRHTRLDADYLDALIRERAGTLRERVTLLPNDSLYLLGGRWRYVESRLQGLERSHHLVEIADSEHLRVALAASRGGATLGTVSDAIAAVGGDYERAASFAGQLLDAQVLVPTLAVQITGRLPLDALIDDLDALGDEGTVAVLRSVRDELASLDAEGPVAPPARYEEIATQLRELHAPVERTRLLQVDVSIPAGVATLARSTVDDVIRCVELLRRIAAKGPHGDFEAFREAFRERYEGREVPLLEALDDELGIGFGARQRDPAPLLRDVALPARGERELAWGARERRLLELLHRAWAGGTREVALTQEDLVALQRDESPPLPNALAATVVPVRTPEGMRIVVSGVAGPSGAAPLGRFCHADPALAEYVRCHLRAEEALDPDAIHAEIVHLPCGRMVNLLARPVVRDYEIEWLGRSGAAPARRIAAADLSLSLREDRFVLRSRTINRRVLPRLTSAHNFDRRSPGVYRFLAAMQSEGTASRLGWSWLPFDDAPFHPRVRWGRLVLARASWRVGEPELRALNQPTDVGRWRSVQALRERLELPRWVTVVDYDNLLAIDLDNALSVDALVRLVRRREQVLLEELYPGPDELITQGPDGMRALEIVVPLTRDPPARAQAGERGGTAAALPEPLVAAGGVRRTFAPGSEWAYLKLYTGSATADRLLRDAVAQLARELIRTGAADRWFFLRYSDPRFHLRVRFHGDPDAIRTPLEQLAARALEEGLAHEALLGTYVRELERYGGHDAIVPAEQVFHADSDAVLDLLAMFDAGAAGLDERWRIGLLGTDMLMRDLGLDQPERARQSLQMRQAFEAEFHADKRLRRAVSEKLRAERTSLDELLDARADRGHQLAPGIRVLAQRSERIAPIAAELVTLRDAGKLALSIEQLAASHVHMWLNRLCRSENRVQEYLTYALLARVHEARLARSRSRP